MELAGQDERITHLLEEANGVLMLDREKGVRLSTESYKTLRQRMHNAWAAGKGTNQLKKFSAATDLAIIIGAVKSELGGERNSCGLLNAARRMLEDLSACPGMQDAEGRRLLGDGAKAEILWNIRQAACEDQRKFTLISGELNPFVMGIVMRRVEENTGRAIPDQVKERYRMQSGRAAVAFR